MDAVEEGRPASIYKVSRSIKRCHNASLYNLLLSINHDSLFVAEIAQLWPDLPLVANLRCGLWYSPVFHSTSYFKSTDGHCNSWSFNTSRLNLHLALPTDWTNQLEATGIDISELAVSVKKPFRPLWISQKTVIWLNEVPDSDSWSFTPIILLSASSSDTTVQPQITSEFSWHYIPGAGDDEEAGHKV